MVKTATRIITIIFVIAIIASISVSAFADGTWADRFGNFAYTVQGHNNGYVFAVQRFLQNYNTTTATLISNAGGVDGSFGPGTKNAVSTFQLDYFNDATEADGEVGPKTWRAVRYCMTASGSSITFFKRNNAYIICAISNGSGYNYYYYTGNGNFGSNFHTD